MSNSIFIGIIILLIGFLTICSSSKERFDNSDNTNNGNNGLYNENNGNTGNNGLYNENNGNTGNTGNTGNNGSCPKGCAADMNNTNKCSTRTSTDGQQYKDCPLSCWSDINVQDKSFCLYDSDCDECPHVKIPMSSCSLTENEVDCNQLETCKWENNMCVDDPSHVPKKKQSDSEKKMMELLFLALLERKKNDWKHKEKQTDISGQNDIMRRQLDDGSVLFPGTTVIIFENGRALQKNNKSDSNSDIYTHSYYNKWGVPQNPIDRRTNNLFSAFSKASSHFTGPVNLEDPASTTSPPSTKTDFGPVAFNANDYIKIEKK